MTHLYLIRHGEAVVNVKPIIGGVRGDVGLTDHGKLQAERLRDRLATTQEIAADVLIGSTLLRARQTAEIIAPALGLPILWDDEVQELRVGEADGMTLSEAWAKFGLPDFYNYPLRPISPGGENWGQFMLRVASAMTRITHDYAGKTIVVVCHGGVIDGTFLYFTGANTLALPPIEFHTQNTSITHWHWHTVDRVPRWRLMIYNDITHLRGIGTHEGVRWSSIPEEPDTGHPGVPLPTEDDE